MWSYPRHILVTDQEEVEKIRTDVSAALARSNSTDPRACLIDWLKDTQNRTMEKEKKERKEHITNKAHIKQKLTSIYNLIGDGMGKMGKISPPSNEREQDQIDFLEKERDNIEEELAKTTQNQS